MPFRTRAAVTGAAVTAAAALLCPAPAARAASAGPGWSAAPSGADRPYFYLEGAPGTAMTDRLAVGNPSDRAVTVRLRGDGARDGAGAWLLFGTAEVTVPPRTRATVPFTVTVPRDAAPGFHPGTIVATGQGAPGVRSRVPVRLRVTGPALSALTVEQLSVRRQGSAAAIRYTLVNRGNTVLRPRLAVRADGLFGPLLRRAGRALPVTLPPGGRVDRTETWPDPPALDAVDVRLTATAAGGAHDVATAGYTAVPRDGAAAVVLLLAAGGGLAVVRRRRRAGRTDPASVTPAPGAVTEVTDTRTGASSGTGTGTGTRTGSGVRA
ncbi:hypothetical protein GCM10010211_29680 [Streptomyces albospinus]|uniref:DUF916 domain-containing protein n=1 Tax=Streptomyces albospinus TaxID=285515 RepID=A0ABQ2V1X3_9ACTN|nr:hypothetical protein [Streptomyces albospinus]GGU62849.1 hypothetical protein GCM10010211_29680 [Streptomyces albospinus]